MKFQHYRLPAVVIIGALTLLLAAACSTKAPASEGDILWVGGDRPRWDVEEMVKLSDAVVVGTIERDLGSKQDPGIGDPPSFYYDYKDYEFVLGEILYSKSDLPKRIAILTEQGIVSTDGVTVVGPDDIPDFRMNEPMLLFLESLEGPKFSDGVGRPVPKGFTEKTYFQVLIGATYAKLVLDDGAWKDERNDQKFTAERLRSVIEQNTKTAR